MVNTYHKVRYLFSIDQQLVSHHGTSFLMQYKRVRELQRKSHTHYFYEATVGAGLPIISTLRSLVETGDKIVKVEGVFRSVSRGRVYVSLQAFKMY